MNRKTIVAWLRAITLIGIYGGLLMPLVFVPVVIFPFVFSKLIFLQVLIGLTFPAYVILAWMEPRVRPQKHLLLGAILLYFTAVIFSAIFSVDAARSWWGNQERMNGLFSLLHFFAWLLMATGLLKTWSQWRRLLNFELALSVIMALVSVLQIPFPRLLLFPVSDRIGGLLDNPIYMAAYQIFNIFFALWLLAKSPAKSTKGIYAGIIVLQLIAFFLAQSRGALVGLAAGFIMVGIVVGLTVQDRRIKRGVIAAVVGMFAIYGILFSLRNTEVIKHSPFARVTSGFSAIPEPRLIAWKIAWEGFKERPLVGWGFDDFHILFNLKYNPQSLRYSQYETWFDRSHNAVMDVLAMTGLIGLIGFLSIYIAIFWSLYRAYKNKHIDSISFGILAGLPVAYFVQNIFVFDHPAAFTMSYLMFALVIALSSPGFHVPGLEPKESPVTEVNGKSHGFSLVSFILLQLVFSIVVWRYSVLPFNASKLVIQANSLLSAQPPQYAAAFELMKQARAIPTPYLGEQASLEAKDLTEQATSAALRNYPKRAELLSFVDKVIQDDLAQHPRSTNALFLAARFYQQLATFNPSYKQTSLALYQRAVETSPRRQQLYFALADYSYNNNQPEQALAYEKYAMELDPELGQAHLGYGLSLSYRGNDPVNGAKEIILSQTVAFPYPLSIQEFPAVAEAAFSLKSREVLVILIERHSQLGTTAQHAQLYGEFGKRLMNAGYKDLRDQLLRAVPVEISARVRQVSEEGVTVSNGVTLETMPIEDEQLVTTTKPK